MKVLTIYDGSLHSKTALHYGIEKVEEENGELIVLFVFQSSLYIDYDGSPRAQKAARAEMDQQVRDVEKIIKETGSQAKIRIMTEEGEPEKELLHTAQSERADLILAPPRYKAIARTSPCPAYFIPGTILVPVDSSDMLMEKVDNIVAEAKRTGSKIMILGVVPVHLYGIEETKELELVRKNTSISVKKMKKALSDRGIETDELIRAGYPYEEILKAADDLSASLIMLPSGGTAPSELTKAAAILLDEPAELKRPIYLLHAAGAY
jgi:nucleotide-binding universal stress UspA family protein